MKLSVWHGIVVCVVCVSGVFLGCADSEPLAEVENTALTEPEPLNPVEGEGEEDAGPREGDSDDSGDAESAEDSENAESVEDADAGQGDGIEEEEPPLVSEEGPTFPKSPDATDSFFEPGRVLDVVITMDPSDWESLRKETRTITDILAGDCLDSPQKSVFSWYSGSVSVDGMELADVGIRKKGFLGSLSYFKPSLKIRFDKYVEGQLLEGVLKRLTLNNVQQDGSKLNTCLSYGIFAAAGLPAPRCGYATLRVNGEDMGLFVHVDSIKPLLLSQYFENTEGNLYEGTLSDFREDWSGTFEKKNNEEENDWSDIQGVIAALADETPAGIEALADWIDLDQFLSFWALEALVAHWDGYAGNRNNYYLYRAPEGRFVFLPWGMDSSLLNRDKEYTEKGEVPPPKGVLTQGAIAHRLYNDPTMREFYVDRLFTVMDLVWDEEFLLSEVNRLSEIVDAYTEGDEKEYALYDRERVVDFIENRRSDMEEDMVPTPSWAKPLDEANICWPELGGIDISFSGTWGTLEEENGLSVGEANVALYDVVGETLEFVDNGVTGGYEVDPESGEVGSRIALIFIDAEGVVDILSFYVAPFLLKADTSIVLDHFFAVGYRIRFAPPYVYPEFLGQFGGGTLELEAWASEEGTAFNGRVVSNLYGFGGEEVEEVEPEPVLGLVINELAAAGDPLDWAEFYNGTETLVDLSTYSVADDLVDESKRVLFPAGTVVASGDYLSVEFDSNGWAGFALAGNEELGIWDENGKLVDSVKWSNGSSGTGMSYARIPDQTGPFQSVNTPTPGAPNGSE